MPKITYDATKINSHKGTPLYLTGIGISIRLDNTEQEISDSDLKLLESHPSWKWYIETGAIAIVKDTKK